DQPVRGHRAPEAAADDNCVPHLASLLPRNHRVPADHGPAWDEVCLHFAGDYAPCIVLPGGTTGAAYRRSVSLVYSRGAGSDRLQLGDTLRVAFGNRIGAVYVCSTHHILEHVVGE